MSLHPMQILIAEDHEEQARLYKKILDERGHKITFTKDGQECIDVFKEDQAFDVVVLDYQMPKKNGLDTAKEILSLKPTQRIIFASAHVEDILKEAVQHLKKATELLEKPFKIDTLVDTIEDKKLYEELEKFNANLANELKSIQPSHDDLKNLIQGAAKILSKRHINF